ncbi:MAG TPA: AAA family ATPase, partial [Ktedonobacteraceae bacterium]
TELQVIHLLLKTVALDLPTGARALTISGEMGVGKSRLLAEMYAEARSLGFRVLEGRTYESGKKFPYLPFFEALRPLLRSSSTERLRYYVGLSSTLSGVDERESDGQQDDAVISPTGMPLVAALVRLFPELPRALGVTIRHEILSPDQEKFRFLDAMATLLERIAQEQPVLLGIDNLQWADSASLELMMYLTVRLHNSPVALVGASRPVGMQERVEGIDNAGTTNANGVKAFGELMQQGLLLLLPLRPLDAQAAEQHLHALLPGKLPDGIAQVLLARAGGNSFFLEELVRMLSLNRQLVFRGGEWRATRAIDTELPGSIMLATRQRLQELSAPCRELLQVAALFGQSFPLDALTRVLEDREYIAPLSLIEEAVKAAVIALVPIADEADWYEYAVEMNSVGSSNKPVTTSQLTSPTYMFCQGIVQEVLNAEIPANRTNALHAAIGEAFEAIYAPHTAIAHAAELARHYMLGGNKAAALRWNLLAGEYAARQQAHREAIDHFRLVLRLLEAGETSPQAPSLARLHHSIGELWFKIGELERAVQAFQQSLELLQRPQPTPAPSQEVTLELAQVNRLLGDAFRMQGKYDQALAHLQAARTALTFGVEQETPFSQETTAVPWFPGRSFASTRDVLTIERVSVVERILLLQAQATLSILLFRKEEAEIALWQSHQLATEIGDRGSQAFALHLVGWLRGWGEHIHEAIRLQEQAHELYIAIGDPFRAVLGEHGLGSIYQALGETKRARLYTTRGFERARRYGVRYSLGWLHRNFGTIALTIADWESSNTHLQEAMREAEATNNVRLKPMVLQALAELNFRQGRWREADGYFQESIQAAVNTEWYPGTIALYGHFLAVTGRRVAARVQLDLATAIPEPPGYGGDYYIPFLAEGYLHLGANEQATTYVERIRRLRGFMYYGISVDRILGVVATKSEDWDMAEQAFEKGLALCQRADNQPEEAAILYEQARALLVQSRTQAGQNQQLTFQRISSLCELARTIFLRYSMQRAVDLVDTLQEGVRQLLQQEKAGVTRHEGTAHQLAQIQGKHAVAERGYHLDLSLTRRELEVLRLVAEGHTDREVAEILVISPRTINRHLSNIYIRLDVPGRAGAVAYAIRHGLV